MTCVTFWLFSSSSSSGIKCASLIFLGVCRDWGLQPVLRSSWCCKKRRKLNFWELLSFKNTCRSYCLYVYSNNTFTELDQLNFIFCCLYALQGMRRRTYRAVQLQAAISNPAWVTSDFDQAGNFGLFLMCNDPVWLNGEAMLPIPACPVYWPDHSLTGFELGSWWLCSYWEWRTTAICTWFELHKPVALVLTLRHRRQQRFDHWLPTFGLF